MAKLVLQDGTEIIGDSFGHNSAASGEIVFQTGMVGYVESLTDPSYYGQILVLTYPLIGNYGIEAKRYTQDNLVRAPFQSDKIHVRALIVGDYIDDDSHWTAVKTLSQWLKEERIPAISGVDTRALTKKIRDNGTILGQIVLSDGEVMRNIPDPNLDNMMAAVSCKSTQLYNTGGYPHIIVVDCGVKYNIIHCLTQRGAQVLRVPWDYDWTQENFDGVVISNGPGDAALAKECIQITEKYIQSHVNKPLFGICMGNQILGIAIGAKTYKLKCGNRGFNQPCIIDSNHSILTTQNHGHAVDTDTLPADWFALFQNANDLTNEGIAHETKPFFSVQFHPEAGGGPKDAEGLFDIFLDSVQSSSKGESVCIKEMVIARFAPIQVVESKFADVKTVLILGSGGLSIGQAGEFDYSGSQALKAFKEEGIHTILVNPNIATVQTSKGMADKIYSIPITPEYVAQVIECERPDGIVLSFGGQTALNCGVALHDRGLYDKYNIKVLGTSIDAIKCTEDRQKFAEKLRCIGENVAFGKAASSVDEAVEFVKEIGYPVLVRADFSLGGMKSGFASNNTELNTIVTAALVHSQQVFVDKSLKGWKEIEYEVMRDVYGNAVTICNMENLDPVGIHTGESIVVAPSQTLTDSEYQQLRSVSLKIAHHLEIVGECNVQFALNPTKNEYCIIEVNARLSRSSALASKATGYSIAYVAAKLALNMSLLRLENNVTGSNTACFEPSLDYVTVKIPRWDFGKFAGVNNKIGSSMKSVGEVMAIGRKFEEAFQKALRMSDEKVTGLDTNVYKFNPEDLSNPSDKRVFSVAAALREGYSVEELSQLTQIDPWFLSRMKRIVEFSLLLESTQKKMSELDPCIIIEAKKLGFSDKQIARSLNNIELNVRKFRLEHNIVPYVKQIDTVAGEYPAYSNYLYLTYNATEHDLTPSSNAILVLGSGVYRIGSSVEFDWCAVGCIRELRKLAYNTIMVNNNPETVSTDYDECDRLYFEELSFETVLDIYNLEMPQGVIVSAGGQLPNNIALALHRQHVNILGTSPEMIDTAENRFKFSRLLDSIQVTQPKWREVKDIENACNFCNEVGYPCLLRPSYVLSGAAMNVAVNDEELEQYLKDAKIVSEDYPVVVTRYILDAQEIDIDAVAQNGRLLVMGIAEHVENAGVHSGDATLITPPRNLKKSILKLIDKIVRKIAQALHVSGPFNLQLIVKEDDIKVIECNLRVSRSLPFISKTLDTDFISLATKVIVGIPCQPVKISSSIQRVGVKVPQFSFSRLEGADCKVGVEMCSTGEVACFGENVYEAYIKALLSRGFKIPTKAILLSIGTYKAKRELLDSVILLQKLNYELYGSSGTADFYSENGIQITEVSWPQTQLSTPPMGAIKTTTDCLNQQMFDLVINIPKRAYFRAPSLLSHGYKIRRLAIDQAVPIIVDIKSAMLFTETLSYLNKRHPPLKTMIDSISTHQIVRLPGLIDVHVHARDPGQTHKEDFDTCTSAALAGGVTFIGAMPNTNPPITNSDIFLSTIEDLSMKARCDFGLFVGATNSNMNELSLLHEDAFALKMYLNQTFSTLQLDDMSVWTEHLEKWPSNKPLCVHAEGHTMGAVILLAELTNRPIHICHIATKQEVELIKRAKQRNIPVTCEVCPHHLFLSIEEADGLGLSDGRREVRPRLQSKSDQQALWDNLDVIDCFATDHAPHRIEEKDREDNPPPGFPGLETMLPLLLTAVSQGRLTMNDIITRLHTNPLRIFNLTPQHDTHIEVDLDEEWTIPAATKHSKAGWTPFAGMKVKGIVKRVVLRGKTVFVDGKVLSEPGSGMHLLSKSLMSPRLSIGFVTPSKLLLPSKKDEIDLSSLPQFPSDITVASTRSPSPDLDSQLQESWTHRNVISVDQFTRGQLHDLFYLSHQMRIKVQEKGGCDLLKGRVLGSVFYEPSTRTSCSFQSAMQRLGGSVIDLKKETSSQVKGESIEDTIQMLCGYCDVVVLRHPDVGVCQRLTRIATKPLINAGDGTGEHPTQALLDIFTIREEIGTVNGLTVTLVGDLKHGRTAHSLSRLLTLYQVRLLYVTPPGLEMPDDISNFICKRGIRQSSYTSLQEVLPHTDVLYMTRIQKERFDSPAHYEASKGNLILTPDLMMLAKEKMIVLHPLPRVDEISPEVDADPRAVYFRQATYGMYIRMALLAKLFPSLSANWSSTDI